MFVTPPQQEHRQTVAIRLGITLLLLLPIGLLVLAGLGESPGKIETVPLAIAAVLVVLCIVLWVVIGKATLAIHPEGLRKTTAFGQTEIRWEDVLETRYRVIPVQVGGLIGYAATAAARRVGGKGATSSLRLLVIARDGSKILVTSNYKGALEAIGVILAKIQPPILADARRRVEAGESVAFGPLSVSRAGVAWKRKEPIPFADLSMASIVGQYLRLKRKGKMFDVAKVRSDNVPNVLVFLDLIEGLGAGAGEIKGIDPLARVRI